MTRPLTDAVVVALGGGPSRGGATKNALRSTKEVGADLVAAARSRRGRLAVLTGGHVADREDLFVLLGLSRKVGLVPGLVTAGGALAGEDARQRLLEGHIGYLRVPIFEPDPIHDGATDKAGGHRHRLEGIEKLLVEGPASLLVEAALEVTAESLPHLDGLVGALGEPERAATLGVTFTAPAPELGAEAWPSAQAVEVTLLEAIMKAVGLGADVLVSWEGFPPCLLDEVAHLRDETLRYGAPLFGPEDALGDLVREPAGTRIHPLPCQECVHLATCPGAPRTFLEAAGERALRPTRRVQANSFNFEVERQLSEFLLEPEVCSARKLELDPTRSLLLVHGDEVFLCRTPTADFTEEEIRRVKDEMDQVYYDLNERAALDDFVETVRRARLSPLCPSCSNRPDCSGAFVVEEGPPFKREERWLRKEVSRLRGRVLDVGCGEGLYRDIVADLIDEGKVDYVGVDPDEAALDRLAASGAGGALHVGEIESFQWEDGWFDYVLLLRSFNHVRDLHLAFSNVSRLLRPGGQLVMADSPVFAMVRTRKQVEHADREAPVGHEHYRNWTSHQVLGLLKRFPLRVDVHRPVSPKTSNQWIVKLMRARDEEGADER